MNDAPTFTAALAAIRAKEGQVRAFIRTRLDAAEAEFARRRAEAPRSELHGLPYSLKDLWDTAGIPTTGGSARFAERVPAESARVHQLFDEAGCVLLGKTNTSDLGLAMESQSYVGDVTRNPHALDRTAGGSSGGAAAAVAAGMSAFDWGSDFGGSIRLPAAFCGVYGLRLSSEAWPLHGHFPAPPTALAFMNGQGPITASLALMRSVLLRAAPRLRTGTVRSFSPRGAYLYSPSPATAGEWPTFAADVRPALVRAAGEVREDHGLLPPERALDLARAMYCSHFEDFVASDELPFLEGLRAVLSALAFKGRFGERRFHPRTAEMLLLIMLGRGTLYRDRRRAQADAARWREQLSGLWDRGYVVVAPTTTFPAPPHGKLIRRIHIGAFNMPGNLADVTGLAVPFGRFPDGLPRSVQLWGPPGSELELLAMAERLERAGR